MTTRLPMIRLRPWSSTKTRAGRGILCALLALVVVAAPAVPAAAGPAASGPAASTAAAAGAVVDVTGGRITGVTTWNGQRQFLGVPFAAPPTGADRFRAPQPVVPWSGTRSATEHGASCPQNASSLQPVGTTSEDCLFVDVFAPPTAVSHRLPVMVFVHGGGFLTGSAAQYDPSPLVAAGPVIVVEMNYRLGPLGFLALPELAAESGGRTGNNGLLDQQAALQWVQRNAAAFGGDPGSVTLFGESAGGGSVCDQLASPSARGLFVRAIVESGACSRTRLTPPPLATAVAAGVDYASSLGCRDARTRAACLRALPVTTLYSPASTRFDSLDIVWRPTVDGHTLPSTPEQALRNGAASGIPVLQGSNRDEGRLFVATMDDLALRPVTAASYAAWVQQTFGAAASRVLARYPLSAYPSPGLAKAQVVTDADFACAGLATTAATAAGGGTTWQYQFSETVAVYSNLDPLMPQGLGSFHGSELFYLFSTASGLPSPVPLDLFKASLGVQMQKQWTTFARTGNPNGPGLPPWPAWRPSAPSSLEITARTSVPRTDFAATHRCGFWSTVPR